MSSISNRRVPAEVSGACHLPKLLFYADSESSIINRCSHSLMGPKSLMSSIRNVFAGDTLDVTDAGRPRRGRDTSRLSLL